MRRSCCCPPAGWLSTALAGVLLASGVLAAWAGHKQAVARPEISSVLLVTFAAALVAVLVRPDPHRIVTRLLTGVRALAFISTVATLTCAVVLAFFPNADEWWLKGPFFASLAPSVLLFAAWARARHEASREARRPRDRQSPWEQYPSGDALPARADRDFYVGLAERLDNSPCPYDEAVRALHFGRAAVRVASSEGGRASPGVARLRRPSGIGSTRRRSGRRSEPPAPERRGAPSPRRALGQHVPVGRESRAHSFAERSTRARVVGES